MSDEENKNAEAARYRRIARDRKAKVEELEAKLAALTTERDTALTEVSTLKTTIEKTPSAERERIAELETTIRNRSHRDAFNKLAAGKIKGDALDAAWKLSDWKADADEINEEDMGKTVDALVASNAFLAASDEATPDQGKSDSPPVTRLGGKPGLTPVSGLGRGTTPKANEKTTPPKIYRLG